MNAELTKFNENQQNLAVLFSNAEGVISKLNGRLNDYNNFYIHAYEIYSAVDRYLTANANNFEQNYEEYRCLTNLKNTLAVALNQVYSIRNSNASETINNFGQSLANFKKIIENAGIIFNFNEKQSFYSDIYSKILDTEKFYQQTGDSPKAAKHFQKLSNAVNERNETSYADVEFDLTDKTIEILRRYIKDFPLAETSEKYESTNFNIATIKDINDSFNLYLDSIQNFIDNANSEFAMGNLHEMIPLLDRIKNAINDWNMEDIARLTNQLELTSNITLISEQAGVFALGFDKTSQAVGDVMQGFMAENDEKRFGEFQKHVESLKNETNMPADILQQHLAVLTTEMKEFENKENYKNKIEQIKLDLQQIQAGLNSGQTE